MRYLLVVVVLAACSSATPTTADPTDARICAAAEQVPYQGPTIEGLLANGTGSPIQAQAQTLVDEQHSTSGKGVLRDWDALTAMCVQAGF